MARDMYHNLVRTVLINDGWKITHDPYRFEKWDPEWEIDLGAEKENTKIAVEVKSFLKSSFANEFHSVLGQYINYRINLSQFEVGRTLYLAVPADVWKSQFQRKGIQLSIKTLAVKVLVYNEQSQKIVQWI